VLTDQRLRTILLGSHQQYDPNPLACAGESHGTPVENPVEAVIRVFLVDDHEVVRRGVRELLESAGDMEIVGEAGTASEALQRVPAVAPDVAVLDVRLPDGNGVEVCRDLRSEMPDLKCLMLTSFTDDEALFDAIMAGAAGYVLKEIRGSDLIESVRRVAAGHSLLNPHVTARVLERLRNPAQDARSASLTAQEWAILAHLAEGLTNRQIAAEMLLAEKTVKNYVSNMLSKLGMSHRTEAAVYAARLADRRRPQPNG
jgi:two-component system response regulator DevR